MPSVLRFLVVVLALHLSAVHAAADPIRVVEGNLSFDTGGPPSFTFVAADGRTYVGEGFTTNWDASCFYRCPAGTSVPVSISPAGADGSDFLSRDGVEVFPVIRLNFTAPDVTLPPDTGATMFPIFTAPFDFSGQLTGFLTRDLSGTPLFDVALTGRGTASLGMYVEEGRYSFTDLIYDFESAAPVPEPGTLLLATTAGAVLWTRRRRRVR
jgi:hypothetical protein